MKRFEAREVIYAHQLPREVGMKTMDGLVDRGIVAVVPNHKGRFSMEYGWCLVKWVMSKSEL